MITESMNKGKYVKSTNKIKFTFHVKTFDIMEFNLIYLKEMTV